MISHDFQILYLPDKSKFLVVTLFAVKCITYYILHSAVSVLHSRDKRNHEPFVLTISNILYHSNRSIQHTLGSNIGIVTMIGLSKVISALSLLTLNSEMVHSALIKGEVTAKAIPFNVRRGSEQKQRLLQKNRNCPKTYSLLHCDDPSIVYAIPCDWDTCLWDTSVLDPLNPPAVCNALTIVDPNAAGIPVAIRPCAIWSIMYGEHQSAPPTTSGMSNLNCFALCSFV
jgi:hypothetical protein